MADIDDPDWTPEKERDSDPDEFMKMGKQLFSSLMKEQQAREQREKETLEEFKQMQASGGRVIQAYMPPLLSEILARYELVWKAISAKFEDQTVRVEIFRTLLHQPFRISDTDKTFSSL